MDRTSVKEPSCRDIRAEAAQAEHIELIHNTSLTTLTIRAKAPHYQVISSTYLPISHPHKPDRGEPGTVLYNTRRRQLEADRTGREPSACAAGPVVCPDKAHGIPSDCVVSWAGGENEQDPQALRSPEPCPAVAAPASPGRLAVDPNKTTKNMSSNRTPSGDPVVKRDNPAKKKTIRRSASKRRVTGLVSSTRFWRLCLELLGLLLLLNL